MTKGLLRQVLFMGEALQNKTQERVHTSLHRALKNGGVVCATLRVTEDGSIEKET
jgi:hypothetical protein